MQASAAFLAQSSWDGQILAPVVLALGLFAIPLVGILTRHQRKMAEIIHGRSRENQLLGEVEALRSELMALRQHVRSLGDGPARAGEADELAQRLG